MRIDAPDELSAFLLAERLGRERCRIGRENARGWYLDYRRPATPAYVAELLASVRSWLAEERIGETIVWIGGQPAVISA